MSNSQVLQNDSGFHENLESTIGNEESPISGVETLSTVSVDVDEAASGDEEEKRSERKLGRRKTHREEKSQIKELVDATSGHVLPYVSFAKLEQVVKENQELFDNFIDQLKKLKEKNNSSNQ